MSTMNLDDAAPLAKMNAIITDSVHDAVDESTTMANSHIATSDPVTLLQDGAGEARSTEIMAQVDRGEEAAHEESRVQTQHEVSPEEFAVGAVPVLGVVEWEQPYSMSGDVEPAAPSGLAAAVDGSCHTPAYDGPHAFTSSSEDHDHEAACDNGSTERGVDEQDPAAMGLSTCDVSAHINAEGHEVVTLPDVQDTEPTVVAGLGMATDLATDTTMAQALSPPALESDDPVATEDIAEAFECVAETANGPPAEPGIFDAAPGSSNATSHEAASSDPQRLETDQLANLQQGQDNVTITSQDTLPGLATVSATEPVESLVPEDTTTTVPVSTAPTTPSAHPMAASPSTKEAAMTELKAIKTASLQAKNTQLLSEVSNLRGRLAVASGQLRTSIPPADIVRRHIKLLHAYNDIKDIGQGLLGMIAESRDVRVVSIMGEFGVGVED